MRPSHQDNLHVTLASVKTNSPNSYETTKRLPSDNSHSEAL